MVKHAKIAKSAPSQLAKADPHSPALIATARDAIAVKAGTIFDGHTFAVDTPVDAPTGGYIAGADYVVVAPGGKLAALKIAEIPDDPEIVGGFHFAPGGNAAARAGGDDVPAVNPFSLWDVRFRPSCPDPRGMTLVKGLAGNFWCDIYLTGVKHPVDGTSKFGAKIADGADCPLGPNGKPYKKFDYATAVEVMESHGKRLLSIDEFFAAAFGVAEKSAASRDPKITGLDAPRTSRFGLMQATGNLWVWGHDGDPDEPRASLFGGSWLYDDSAGSRCANVGYWPDNSDDNIGARGRSDHLQPV